MTWNLLVSLDAAAQWIISAGSLSLLVGLAITWRTR
jgi:hypothetical protein